MVLFGLHIDSTPANIIDEIIRVKQMKGNLVQLFVDPNYKNLNIYNDFAKSLVDNKMHCVVHASYTINLAQEWNNYSWAIQQLIDEIEIAAKCGAFAIVVHLGKLKKLSLEQAYNNMYTGLLYVHNKTKQFPVKILLETSTGMGSEMCYKIEDLSYFFKKFSKNNNVHIRDRFKICLDTCHIFQAGYDIRTTNMINLYFDTFEELIGIRHIALVHLNDSKHDIGHKLDRHAAFGDGYIGIDALKIIIKFFKNNQVPIILETPDGKKYKKEMKLISDNSI